MKICIVIRRLSQSWGGAERVAVNLCKELIKNGYEVYVITGATDVQIEGVNIEIIKVNKAFSPLKILSFQREFKKIIDEQKFDIIYGLCQVYPVDIYRVGGGIHSHWMKVKYPNAVIRWIKYLTSLVHLVMRFLEGKIFQKGNCKFFITNSKLIKDQIIEYFQIPEERIKVIYNGVDHGIFNPDVKVYREAVRKNLNISSNELVLLFVSNNWERKGLKTIIDAMSMVEDENIRLVVIGRGKKGKYISFSKAKKINPDRLIFVGHVKDVEKFYGMADIFILPTMYEPFSNVCLEAMACGLPIVTTKTNGASELIKEGINGFVLRDWNDSEKLAEIIRILKDPQMLEIFGNNASETAKDFTWQRHIEETNMIFKSLTK